MNETINTLSSPLGLMIKPHLAQDPTGELLAVLEQVIEQGVQTGQIPETASEDEKKKAARAFMQSQLQQAENQIKQAETRRDLALNQRRIGGTGTAVVLVIAFALLALAAVL